MQSNIWRLSILCKHGYLDPKVSKTSAVGGRYNTQGGLQPSGEADGSQVGYIIASDIAPD